MYCLPLTLEKKKEWLLINNGKKKQLSKIFFTETKPINTTHNHPCSNGRKIREEKNHDYFTYYSPKIKKITNIFKYTNIGIALRNRNIFQQISKPKTIYQATKYDENGVYKHTNNKCHGLYIGQTSSSLRLKFQEHTRYIKHNEPQSAYALHILNCKHEYSTFGGTMTILNHIEKPSRLLPYEQLYIKFFYHNNQLIPEQHPNKHVLFSSYLKIHIIRQTPPNISINTSMSTRQNQFHSRML